MVIYSIWYNWLAHALGYNLPFLSLVMLSLITHISIIFKLTPGNLGINQIISGVVLNEMGLPPAAGVAITLLSTVTTIFISFTIGLAGNYFYFGKVNISKELFAKSDSSA
jgi:hypothetical protein